eukprot:440447-Prorocentrum_minimum.AAC.2
MAVEPPASTAMGWHPTPHAPPEYVYPAGENQSQEGRPPLLPHLRLLGRSRPFRTDASLLGDLLEHLGHLRDLRERGASPLSHRLPRVLLSAVDGLSPRCAGHPPTFEAGGHFGEPLCRVCVGLWRRCRGRRGRLLFRCDLRRELRPFDFALRRQLRLPLALLPLGERPDAREQVALGVLRRGPQNLSQEGRRYIPSVRTNCRRGGSLYPA